MSKRIQPHLLHSPRAGAMLFASSLAFADVPPTMPPIVGPALAKPDAEGQKPRAVAVLAPYRYDDILWENDRTAHRIYGHALEAHEPPSSSGIDAGARVSAGPTWNVSSRPEANTQYHGEGLDFYDVNTTRGAGGLGIWQDNKLWVSRNWKSYKILKNGPEVAAFTVDYAPWPVDVERKVWETRTFTLPLGTNFTRLVSTLSSDKPDPLIVGIGITRRKGPTGSGVFSQGPGSRAASPTGSRLTR